LGLFILCYSIGIGQGLFMETRYRFFIKIVLLLALFLCAVFVVLWIYKYFNTGKIILQTNAANAYVRINYINQDGSAPSVAAAQKEQKLTARVRPGSYVLTAFSPLSSSSKTVNVKARQSLRISLNLPGVGPVTPVYGSSVKYPVTSASEVLFLDRAGHLSRINSQNQPQVLDTTHSLKSAQWLNTSLGATQDTSQNFYLVKNGVLSAVTAPFQVSGSPSSSYALAPDGTLYLSNGQTVYKSSVDGSFTQIYSSGNNYNVSLAASNESIAVIEKNSKTGFSSAVIVTSSGKILRNNVQAIAAAWSTDGSYLLLASDTGNNIWNNSYRKVAPLPQKAAANFAWNKDNVLLYTAGNQLFAYNVSSKQGNQIARIPNNGSIEGISLSDDSYIYMVAKQRNSVAEGSSNQLFKIGLKNQKPPKYVQSLSVFLPETIGVCLLNYINFTKPTITVSYPNFLPTPERCVIAAKKELSQYDSNPDKFEFSLSPYSPAY
jgi:hypothetical protein